MTKHGALLRGGLTSALLLGLLAGMASAQQYKSDATDPRARTLGTIAKQYVKRPSGNAEDRKRLDDYLKLYHLPAMTQSTAEGLAEVEPLRTDLLKSFLRPAEPALQKELTKLVLESMKGVAGGPYHPSVRVNAILTIGQLDAEYVPDAGAGARQPQPLPEATAFLLAVLKSGLTKPNVPPALVVAALTGLERHARFSGGLPANARAELLSTLTATIDRKPLPQRLSDDVEEWITLQAARALAGFGVPGPENQVHNKLVALASDDQFAVQTRCEVAGLLGQINYAGATGIDEPALVKSLTSVATAVVAAEMVNVVKYKKEQVEGLVSDSQYGLLDGLNLPTGYKRRRVLGQVETLRASLAKLLAAVTTEQPKQALTELKKELDATSVVLLNKESIDLEITDEIERLSAAVAAIAEGLGVDAPEATAEPAADPAEALLGE